MCTEEAIVAIGRVRLFVCLLVAERWHLVCRVVILE